MWTPHPTTPGDTVVVAFLVLPTPAAGQLAAQSWTVAATASLLPDRFTAYGYRGDQLVFTKPGGPVRQGLAVSPNPNEPPATQLKINEDTGTLNLPPALRWLTDFTEAVTAGMGIRVTLTDDFRDGVDRIVVLGLREQPTPQQSAAAFAGLLTDQLRSPSGFSLLPQGTPTNNSEERPAGQDPRAEADAGLATVAGFAAAADDWTTKTDGEWFAELLGLDPAVLAGVPNVAGTDRREARAAHTALWPATWGYFLPALLDGVLTPEQVAETRKFFLANVSGRGPLPVVKIGRQPYGILPTTVFSRLTFPATAPHRTALNAVLKAAAQDWHAALELVANLDELEPGDDRHQLLLNILALHPTSAEYRFRYAQSPTADDPLRPVLAQAATAARELLTRLGAAPDTDPEPLLRVFADAAEPLVAPVVDDRPLSETNRIRPYTTDSRDYLTWLAESDAATVLNEQGFVDDLPPSALLYLLARHAVLQASAQASPAEVAAQAEALGILAALPTARLERVFAEHLDWPPTGWTRGGWGWSTSGSPSCGSARRHRAGRPGLHLGAYGWLEHVGRAPTTVTTWSR